MIARRHDIMRAATWSLLILFVIGGLLLPVLHRAHHGLSWAELRADSAERCDHSQHDSAIEAYLATLADDHCILCARQWNGLDGPTVTLFTSLAFGPFLVLGGEAVTTADLFPLSARDPPLPA